MGVNCAISSLLCATCCLAGLACQGQELPNGLPPTRPGKRWYLGAEAIIFNNQDTRFAPPVVYLTAEQNLTPCPAIVVGYLLAPYLAAELRVQDLPVLTGYSYNPNVSNSHAGGGQRYTQDYLYVPVHLVWRIVGRQSKLGLSVLGGAGPAWTDTSPGPLNPNGTSQSVSTTNGVVTSSITATQHLTRQQGFFMGFEAGVRGTWQPWPRLGVDLSVRQLWSTTQSARDIKLDLQVDNQPPISTTMQTPVRGICTGLGVHYLL